MRFIHATILIVFAAAVGVFCFQNMQTTVAVDYLDRHVSLPLPGLVLIAYLVGMVSGWAVLSFLRRSIRRVTEHHH